MRARRPRVTRSVLAFCAAGLFVLLTVEAAWADCHTTNKPSGSKSLLVNSKHTGSASWNASTKNLAVSMDSGSLASGRCADTWFDWATQADHYDARVVRTCVSSNHVGLTRSPEPTTNPSRVLIGMQKNMACVWDQSDPTHYGTCVQNPDALPPPCIFDASLTSPVLGSGTGFFYYEWRKRSANGTTTYWNGGNPALSTQ